MSNSEPLQSFIKKLQKAMEPLNRLLNTSRALSQENQKLEKKLQGLNSELGSATSVLGKAKTEIIQLAKQLHEGGKANDKYIQTLRKSQQSAEKINNRQKKLQNKITQQQNVIKNKAVRPEPLPARSKENIIEQGRKTYDKAKGAINTIGEFIRPGVRFEKKMSEIQAKLSINGDDTSIKLLRQQSHELSSLYGLSPTNIADAQLSVVQQGYQGKDIAAATLATLPLSLLDDLDINSSSSVFRSLQKSFDIPMEESQRIADVLTTGFALGSTNLSDFANSLKELAPIAHDSGISLEETAAVLSIMSERAIDKEQAESSSKALLIQLASGTTKTKLSRLGIPTQEKNGESLPINQIIESITTSFHEKGLDVQQQSKYLKEIFNDEALSAARQLIESVKTGKLSERITAEKNSNGSSLHLLDIKNDNLDGDLNRMQSAWDKIKINLFGGKNDLLRGIIQTLTNLLTKIDEWIAKNPVLSSDIATFIGGIALLQNGMSLFGGETLKIPTILSGVMRGLGMLMRIPYIGWIIGIATAIAFIWINWDTIREKIKGAIDDIKDSIISATSEIKNALKNIFSLPNLWEMLPSNRIKKELSKLKNMFTAPSEIPDLHSEPSQGRRLKLPNFMNFKDLFNFNPRRTLSISKPGLNFLTMGGSDSEFTQGQNLPTRGLLTHNKPIMAIATTSKPSQVIQSPSITVNVTPLAGQNEHALGREITRQIEKMLLNQETNARSLMS